MTNEQLDKAADLAARCETAEGGSGELDLAIFRMLHPEFAGPEWQPYGGGLRHVNDSSDARCLPPREHTPACWTASLDAAMTLVPEGMQLCVSRGDYASVATVGREQEWHATARTPALALCAAALRAREASTLARKDGDRGEKCDHNWHYLGTEYHGSHKGEDMHKCHKCGAIEYLP